MNISTVFEIIIGVFAGYCCCYFICMELVEMRPEKVLEEWLKIKEKNLVKIADKLKKRFCKHDYELVARHLDISAELYKCKKCKTYGKVHHGLSMGIIKGDKEGNWNYVDK